MTKKQNHIIIKIFQLLIILFACLNFLKCNINAEHLAFKNAIHSDTLSFEITDANNIIFSSVLDEKDTLDLYLDTGGTELVLKHSAIKERTSLLDGKNDNYQEVNYDPLEGVYALSLNQLSWDSLTIYPTSLLPEEADGHFGWNLFDGKVVELDYENKWMIVHDSLPKIASSYAKMDIEYINTLFCINTKLEVAGRKFSNRYLFDTGFQRAVVMDRELRIEDDFPTDLEVIKESRLRNSEGTEFVNQVVAVDKICFDTQCASKVPVQLLSTPNPARFKTHILGNELLKRFNTFMDFQNHHVYLKANNLMNEAYKDAMISSTKK